MYKIFLVFLLHISAFLILAPGLAARDVNSYLQSSDGDPYLKAVQLAHAGRTEEALAIAIDLYDENPLYHDVAVLIARIYSWEKKFDTARYYLRKVAEHDPEYHDAMAASIDVELWEGNRQEALNASIHALSIYPDDEGFLIKKARAYILDGKFEEAISVLNLVISINSGNQEAIDLLKRLSSPGFYHYRENNYVLAGYSGDYFNIPYNRRFHIGTAGYSHYTRIGPVIGKINFANTFIDGTGLTRYPSLQYEIESYPKISQKFYLMLNYAYSRGLVFPDHRAALEIFRELPSGFEVSAGFRYLYWDRDYFFYTGSIGKYYGEMWFSLRPYIFPHNSGVSSSWYFNARKYFDTSDDFAGIIIGFGLSPDESVFDPTSRDFLNSNSAGFEYSAGISTDLLIRGSLRFEYEEFTVSSAYRNRWMFNIGLRYYL
jgi:YaiO family outer membrane protein